MSITPGQAANQVAALERSGQVSYITSLNLQAQLRGMARNPNIQLPDDFVQQRIVSYGQEHGSSEGGTYTSPSGQRITSAQAQQRGIIDRPGEYAEKAARIGLTKQEYIMQSRQQGRTPEETQAGLRDDISLAALQQRIINRDPNISISEEIRQSRDVYNFLQATQRGSINKDTGRYEQGATFAPGAETKAIRLASKLGSVPPYYRYEYSKEQYPGQYNKVPAPFKSRQERLEEAIFSQPYMTNIDKIRGEGAWGRLSKLDKAGLLVTTGFNKPEIAASYFESKITGKPTDYQEQIYKYAMKDTKFVKILGTDFAVPKQRVIEDVGVGIFTVVAMGAAFKGAAYLASPVIKGSLGAGAKAFGFTEKTLGSLAARSSGVGAKTALQTSETLAGFGKDISKFVARHPEGLIGSVAASAFVAEVARSQTKGEAAEKVIRVAATLPLMGVGYKGAERIGYAMPTARQFKGFVGSKASSLVSKYEPGAMARYARTPTEFKNAVNTIKQLQLKRIKEQSGFDLMTPAAQQIYSQLPTKQARVMMETSQKALSLLEDMTPRELRSMYLKDVGFDITRDFGKSGESIAKILRAQKDDILLGSMSTAKFVKGFRGKRTPTPEGKPVASGIGDIELFSERPAAYIKAGMKEADIHTRKHFPNVEVGAPITTSFGGKKVFLGGGRGKEPITAEGIKYLNTVQQAYQKLEGTYKYLSRKTKVLKGEASQREYVTDQFSIRRGKDAQDIPEIIEALAAAQSNVNKKIQVLALMKQYRQAEATKLYSGVPIEKYGYEFAKKYPKEIKTPPILVGYGKSTPQKEYAKVPAGQKYSYPSTTTEMVKVIKGIYAPGKKPSLKYPPSAYPQKSNYQTLVNLYSNYPYSPTKTKTPYTPTTTKRDPPRKPPETPEKKRKIIKIPSFDSQVEQLIKARKKRGRIEWDINNPIPTLESLIGESETKGRKKRTKKSKK